MRSHLLGIVVSLCFIFATRAAENELTDAEKKDGWVLLFDGKTTTGWKKPGGKAFPDKGWEVVDGTLHHKPKGGGGDIITEQPYENFEFAWEWKLADGANSGMKYRVADVPGAVYGPEYQMLDDAKQADGKNPKTSTGSLYQIYAPNEKRKVNVGGWNSSKVVVNGNHCEHWLNGEKIVEYEFFSDDWKAGVEKSKFKGNPKYAQPAKGHIAIQDHGDEVWVRNIKIKVLTK